MKKLFRQTIEMWESVLPLGNLNLGDSTDRQAVTISHQLCVHMFSQMPEMLSKKRQNGAGRGLGTEAELSLDHGEHTKWPNHDPLTLPE